MLAKLFQPHNEDKDPTSEESIPMLLKHRACASFQVLSSVSLTSMCFRALLSRDRLKYMLQGSAEKGPNGEYVTSHPQHKDVG